jgi:hypothetical protein
MSRCGRRLAVAVAIVMTMMAVPAPPARAAELGVGRTGDRTATVVVAAPSWRSWDLENDAGATVTISQFHLPVTLSVPVTDRLDVVAFGALADSRYEPVVGEAATLRGVVDGRVRALWRPASAWQLGVGVGLPFGDGALDDADEVAVAQLLWAPILDFRSKRAGEGLTVDANAGYAAALSPTLTLGLGAGMVLGSEYDLIDTGTSPTTYRPGTEVSGSVGLDWRPDPTALVRADVAYRATGDDEVNGEAAFRSAPRVEVDLTLARAPAAWFLALRARGVFRGEDRRYTTTGDAVRRQVAGADALVAMGEAYREFGETFSAGLEVEAGAFGESDAAVGDGARFGIGPGLRLGRADATRGQLRALYLAGSAENGDIDLGGWDVSAALAIGF